MEYLFAAIPTIYKDVQFRSRLEARWAAFFDLLSWKWDYEPCDFKGWIPDFGLRPRGAGGEGWWKGEVNMVIPYTLR